MDLEIKDNNPYYEIMKFFFAKIVSILSKKSLTPRERRRLPQRFGELLASASMEIEEILKSLF